MALPELSVLIDELAVCRLPSGAALPAWLAELPFFSITRTSDELSIVIPDESVPGGWQAERGWRAIKLAGPFDFALTGILLGILAPLAQAGVGIFAISTYDTDYVLVKAAQLETACQTLRSAGYHVS